MPTPHHDKPQTHVDERHPSPYDRDLNAGPVSGNNIGERAVDHEPSARAASEDKRAVQLLPEFSMDELREIPVLLEGARLQQGATYLDLDDRTRGSFTARADELVEPDHHVIPKADVPHMYWNRLTGAEPGERRV